MRSSISACQHQCTRGACCPPFTHAQVGLLAGYSKSHRPAPSVCFPASSQVASGSLTSSLVPPSLVPSPEAAPSEAGLYCQPDADDRPHSMLMSVKAGADILASMHQALTKRLSLACRWPLISDQRTESGGRRSGAPEQVPCGAACRVLHDAFSPRRGSSSAALPAISSSGLSWPSGLARLLASGAQPRPILVRPMFWHNHGAPLLTMHAPDLRALQLSLKALFCSENGSLLAVLAQVTAQTHALIGVAPVRLQRPTAALSSGCHACKLVASRRIAHLADRRVDSGFSLKIPAVMQGGQLQRQAWR